MIESASILSVLLFLILRSLILLRTYHCLFFLETSVIANYYGGKLLITPLDVKGNEFCILLPTSLIKEA